MARSLAVVGAMGPANATALLVGGLCLAVVAVLAIASTLGRHAVPDAPTVERVEACLSWRVIQVDLGDGVLTMAELRSALKDVEGESKRAPADVAKASRGLLGAATSGVGVDGAMTAMDAACRRVGQ